MSKRTIHNILQEIVEEKVPAESVDLWPQINQRLDAQKTHAPQRRSAIRLVYRAALVLLIGAAAFLMTPQGRTLAQEYLLQYFSRAESNTRPIPSEVFVTVTARAVVRATETQFATEYPQIPTATPTITPTPAPGSPAAANQTVPEIEEQLGFDVLEPGWLPDLITAIGGASADLEQGIAYQYYSSGASNGLRITQYSVDADIELPEIGATQYVQVVDINGHTGEYVRGAWVSDSRTGNNWVWRFDHYSQCLRWEQDGMIVDLSFWGSRSYMTKDDLIAVAESMH